MNKPRVRRVVLASVAAVPVAAVIGVGGVALAARNGPPSAPATASVAAPPGAGATRAGRVVATTAPAPPRAPRTGSHRSAVSATSWAATAASEPVGGPGVNLDGLSPTEREDLLDNNRVEEALVERLTSRGIDSTLESDEGWEYADYDDTYAEVRIVVDQFYREQEPPSRGEVVDLNDEADALAAHLDAAGVAHTVVTDGVGVRDVLPTPDDDRAELAIEDFWMQEDPPSPGELQEWNDEAHALDRYLTQQGIDHELVSDPRGYLDVDYDDTDDAVNDAVDAFYEDYDPYPDSDYSSLDEDE